MSLSFQSCQQAHAYSISFGCVRLSPPHSNKMICSPAMA
jgi:hypothetical protein